MPPEAAAVPRREIRAAVKRAVFLTVMNDRRMLGIQERVRDQVITWAFNEAMDYQRTILDPSLMVDIDENVDVILDAMGAARDAGVRAFAACAQA